ncbi:hypothetical protein RHGRI_015183 [Rhododendron griersonianum]|uniref:PGG domain-containing protein n=1 Tax=Rhododendron griersonianum TaxID=479676 RepID=A0AAV6KCA2_9ERIC|nr:hypothetical protein RHGRI_015183 [Rhododendron griersonianum]
MILLLISRGTQTPTGRTATELFEDTHSGLRKDAEKALKSMNSGLLLVSALIGTVNYAAVFTLPGGFDSNSNRDSRDYGRPGPVWYGQRARPTPFLVVHWRCPVCRLFIAGGDGRDPAVQVHE